MPDALMEQMIYNPLPADPKASPWDYVPDCFHVWIGSNFHDYPYLPQYMTFDDGETMCMDCHETVAL